MSAEIIDGKKVAAHIRERLKNEIKELSLKPRLGVVLVGNNQASLTYVGAKEKAAQEVGIEVVKHHLPAETTQDKLLKQRLKKKSK